VPVVMEAVWREGFIGAGPVHRSVHTSRHRLHLALPIVLRHL
jgi:hypothetical protein